MVCFKIPERTTSRTLPGGIKDVELFCSPSVVTLSSALVIASTFMSFGDTHGISPFQYAKFSLLGVPPPENRAIYLSLCKAQCSGTSPNQSTPESLYAGYALNPLMILLPVRYSAHKTHAASPAASIY